MSDSATIPWWEAVAASRLPDMELTGYLHRYVLAGHDRSNSAYLHNILASDIRVLHGHPWTFDTFILSGGYKERICLDPQSADPQQEMLRRWCFAGQWYSHGLKGAHQIEEVLPNTWSLVTTGYRCKDWGFWVEDGKCYRFMPHLEFLASDLNTQPEAIFRGAYKGGDDV